MKVNYISLDTCTWIYLANGTEPVKFLDFILQESQKGNIKIIVPEIVIKEWEKNKDNAVKGFVEKQLKKIIDELNRVSKLLGVRGERPLLSPFGNEEEDEKDYFNEIIEKIKNKREYVKSAVQDNIAKIDKIFNSAIVIEIKDSIVLHAGEYALSKKAPFKEKNSFADALILFSFIDYVEQNQIEGAKFISYNTDDFCEKKEKEKHLHSDLKPHFTRSKSEFFKIVGRALKTIKDDIATKEELEQIEHDAAYEFELEMANVEYCEACFKQEIYWDDPIEIPTELKLDEIDDSQMEFAFAEDMPKTKTEKIISKIQITNCSYCGTEHFKCQRCETTNTPSWYGGKTICEGCGLAYFVKTSGDGSGDIEYRIIKDYLSCINCGREYENNGLNDSKMCSSCSE